MEWSTEGLLLETIRAETGRPSIEYASPPVALTGGYFAEILRFRLVGAPAGLDRDLVARITPTPDVGIWESTIQRTVADQGFPTPAVRLTVDSSGPLGRFLVVMDAVDGRSPMEGLGVGALIIRFPRLVRHLPGQLAGIAAELHRLDPEPLAAQLDGLGSTRMQTTTAGFVRQQRELSDGLGLAALVEAAERLLESEPRSPSRVVTHGDLHPFNLLVTDSGEVQLIDWTTSRVAHPGFTVGFTHLMLENPPINLPKQAGAALDRVGRRMADRFLSDYRRRVAGTSGEVDDVQLAWHRKVHALRVLVEKATWDDAGASLEPGHPWILLEPVAGRELGLRE